MLETLGLNPEVFDVMDKIQPISYHKEKKSKYVWIPVLMHENNYSADHNLNYCKTIGSC